MKLKTGLNQNVVIDLFNFFTTLCGMNLRDNIYVLFFVAETF